MANLKSRVAEALRRLAERISPVEPQTAQAHNIIVTETSKAQLLKGRAVINPYELSGAEPHEAERIKEIQLHRVRKNVLKEVEKHLKEEVFQTERGIETEISIVVFKR